MKNSSDSFSVVPLGTLRPGITLRAPILEAGDDNGGVLLLAEGTTLTPSLLKLLERRGVKFIRIHSSDLANCRSNAGGESRRTASRPVERGSSASQTARGSASQSGLTSSFDRSPTPWQISPASYLHEVQRPSTPTYETAVHQRIEKMVPRAVEAITEVHHELADGRKFNFVAVSDLNRKYLEQIATDIDAFVDVSVRPTEVYPSQHSMQTGMLAMTIGTIMGLSATQLQHLGIGCMLHDAGMLRIKFDFRKSRTISSSDLLEISKHPIAAMEMIGNNPKVPHAAKMVVYQMHERMDGSGYPRRRTGLQIHQLSRIAAVADTYLALVSSRPYRPSMAPYFAVEQILYATNHGKFDRRAVRALLHAVSVFPIGSYVELEDGRVGKVLRANREKYMSPIIELTAADGSEILDLSEIQGLEVARPATLSDGMDDEAMLAESEIGV